MEAERCHDGLLDESLDELYENAPVGFFSSLPDGTIVKANATLLRWLGHEREELVGRRRFHDLLAPGARIYYETHYAPLLQMQGQVGEIAVELVRADGSRLPVLLSSILVRDESGAPRVVRTSAVDASDRRRYERELLRARTEAESRARAAQALSHVADGVLLVDEDGRVALLNPAAEAILGVTGAAVVGRPLDVAVPGWSEIAARVPVARAGEHVVAETLPLAGDGRELWLTIGAVDAGDAVAYTFRDVTAVRGLEQARSEMIAIVSHELRTPLAGALGAAQTLLARSDTLREEQRAELLDVVAGQLQRLAKTLDQILAVSRIEAGGARADVARFDARDVIDVVVQSAGHAARRRLVVDAPGPIEVTADLDQLRQVLINLVDNALKYSDDRVDVTLRRREFFARFTVSDSGPGIPESDRQHVFEKFFRLDPQQTRGVGGTGLGLYIARELVQRMGGRLGYAPSERGTSLFVDVPLAER